MEIFSVVDENQWQIIKKDIDELDYYVMIISKCFGSEVLGGIVNISAVYKTHKVLCC